MKYIKKEYAYMSNGKKIYGRAIIPQNNIKMPLVIFSHGFGGNFEQEETLQEELAMGGVLVFSFDFSGGSGYVTGRSEGSTREMSVLTEVNNLKDTFEFASKLELVDINRIYLIGASQGGVVSTLAMEDLKEKVCGLYLLYPALTLFDDARSRYKSLDDIREKTSLLGIRVGKNYFADIFDIDIYSFMKNIDIRTHIFHGTSDELVSITNSKKAIKSLKKAKLTELLGSSHGFQMDVQKEVAKIILDEIMKD